MPKRKLIIKPFACRVTRNGTRNKSITSNLARKGLNKFAVAGMAGLSMAMLVSPSIIRDRANATATQIYFSVDASNPVLEIQIPAESMTMQMTPAASGTFQYQEVNVNVGTNSAKGYTLNMYAENAEDVNLTRTVGITTNSTTVYPTIDALTTSTTPTDFADVTHTASMNHWGYKLGSSSASGNYLPMTTSTTNQIDSYATQTDGYHPTTVTFGVKMNTNTPAGTYGTTITFAAVATKVDACDANAICYDANRGSGGMPIHTGVAASSSQMLDPSNFMRTGYGFAGWNTKADGTGDSYGPMETITTPDSLGSEGLLLYAMWVPSAGTMQSFTCSSLSSGQVTARTDTRDNNTYAIAKLADGKCWMIENLRLDNKPTLNTVATDTDVPGGWDGMYTNSANSTKSKQLPASTDSWCNTDTQGCDDQAIINTNNIANPASLSNYGTGSNVYSYGTYYNWYAATAGSGTYSTSTNAQHVTASLCPSGWVLPQGGATATDGGQTVNTDNSDFYKLGKAITGAEPESNRWTQYYYAGQSNAFRDYPNNFILSGFHQGGAVSLRGAQGRYQSSSAYSAVYFYDLYIDSTAVYPGTQYEHKFYGYSIRCLAGA
ncbi:InlB B-repeat-containing protein [Candidatus Saccharibacteria bacterium]|nr:InlB B-repeat-containing protein [Candidatus Saccharibacteria bacterium]